MAKTVLCKIVEHEIPLKRCKPVTGFRICKFCEGYKLKATGYMNKEKGEKRARE